MIGRLHLIGFEGERREIRVNYGFLAAGHCNR
jgi:hypothetical protein